VGERGAGVAVGGCDVGEGVCVGVSVGGDVLDGSGLGARGVGEFLGVGEIGRAHV